VAVVAVSDTRASRCTRRCGPWTASSCSASRRRRSGAAVSTGADPEGNVWDVAWAKGTTIDDRGGVHFP